VNELLEELLDSDGYPTDEALAQLEQAEPAEAIELLRQLWHPVYGSDTEDLSSAEFDMVYDSFDDNAKYLRLATGGWSGNEEVWHTFKLNRMAYTLYWRLSAQGGLHILKLP
jgi:hypothetical protein